MPRSVFLIPLFLWIGACGPKKSDDASAGEAWTVGNADLSGLGLRFTAPAAMESRSADGTSLVWESPTADEGLTLSYEAALSTATLDSWLGDTATVKDRTVVNAVGTATAVSVSAAKGAQRTYSGSTDSGKSVAAIVVALPRDSVDQTGFGGAKIMLWSTRGDAQALQSRATAAIAGLSFASMTPSTAARQFLAVGEWSFTGTTTGANAGSVGRQLVWLCSGRFAYKQSGATGSSVLEAAEDKLLTGRWETYSGVGQPLLYLKIDGDASPKLMPIAVQADTKAFTWGGKQFLGTDRGCELGLPTQLWASR